MSNHSVHSNTDSVSIAYSDESPPHLPSQYIDGIRPVVGEELQRYLTRHQDGQFTFHHKTPFTRVGVMDWKSGRADFRLRQFNMISLDRTRFEGRDKFTNWQLASAAQIPATEENLHNCLLRMNGVQGRVILLERMTSEVMEILGSVYKIDPQFWAQHYLNRPQPKPFFTVRWCQPVSFDIKNPPWEITGTSRRRFKYMTYNNNPTQLLEWFRSSLHVYITSEGSLQALWRTLRPLYHSLHDDNDDDHGRLPCRVPAGFDQCAQYTFISPIPSLGYAKRYCVRVIVLVDPCPLRIPDKPPLIPETRLFNDRPFAPRRNLHHNQKERWTLDDLWDSIKENHDLTPRTVVWSILELFQRDLIAISSRSQVLTAGIRQGMRNQAVVEQNLRTKS
ncbi:hypothetical protein QBC38DRAFT_546988 [Podospora fimiseda]|uniref:Uncharacterized protein n=1 Tax=Podospora fimiseda TaxID=252190 RepID=A0AAN7BL41_9PEZI|nr:hypothetical protein QBC38DRAFT_546988 [Podospora fimiseda]